MNITDKQFIKLVEKFATDQRRLVEASVDGFAVDDGSRRSRIAKAQEDFRFFAHTYFPHYVTGDDSEFQKFVYKTVPKLINDPAGIKAAFAAPRGEAKSTIFGIILVIWLIVTERKHFIVIIMDALDQAVLQLESIKAEFEANPRLKQDYPAHTGAGDTWQFDDIVTRSNRRIRIAGKRKKLRGWRHGPYRVDFALGDDIENDENVLSKPQRDKDEKWLNKAVLKLGPPDGSMDFFLIGTVLHYDSVLNRFLKNPAWYSRIFKAIINMPDRMDLWDKFDEVFINQGVIEAEKFYMRRRKLMDKGAVVSWPSTRPLLMLMKLRAEDRHSFDSEYQNDPTDSENAPFKVLMFWVKESNRWIFYGSCDPSLGRLNKSRDPSAILVGGYDTKDGVLDVIEAQIGRKVPDLIIETIIQLQTEYRCMLWGVETVQFQEFLMTELIKRSASRGVPVPARGIKPHSDKDLRIASLQPHVTNGLIRFHASQKTLIEQLQHWPEADHDDGPDALHMLWSMAASGSGGIPMIRSRDYGAATIRGYDGYQ